MSKDKAATRIGGDDALTDDELGKVAGGGIKLDGVDGESTHKDHKGEIELASWSTGTTSVPRPKK